MTPKHPTPSLPAALVLLSVTFLLLAGCATAPAPSSPAAPAPSVSSPVPSAPVPVPVQVVEAKPATITGSEVSSTMFDNLTAYVAAVDRQPVAAGRQGWNTPVSLPAGQRRLTVQFNRGVFSARAELLLTARSEAVYQLKFATDAEVFGKNSYAEFWIVETASGERVVSPLRVPLTRITPAK